MSLGFVQERFDGGVTVTTGDTTGAQELLRDAPMQAVWPGLMIFLTVIAFNFLGDGLQDALDPRSERRT